MTGTNYGALSQEIRGGESATVRETKNAPSEIVVTRRMNRRGLLGMLHYVSLVVRFLNQRPIIVSLDGERVGMLQEKESTKCFVGAGMHLLTIETENGPAVSQEFDVEPGNRKRFFCGRTTGSLNLRESKAQHLALSKFRQIAVLPGIAEGKMYQLKCADAYSLAATYDCHDWPLICASLLQRW